MTLYPIDIIADIHDYLFLNNLCEENTDFRKDFNKTYIDYTNCRIYLADELGDKFIIKVERV